MWVSDTRRSHPLRPEAYHRPAQHALERERLFAPAWHCVGTCESLSRDGDFITCTVADAPVIVRRDRGELRAFANVCAHRHCLLTHAPRGHSARMRCQYHGWEYDPDGAVCKIPDAASFVPVRRGEFRLAPLRVATVGQMVFVTCSPDAPPIEASLAPETLALLRTSFSYAMQLAFAWELDHPCNWKIPIENVLETYHVGALHQNPLARHPELFEIFTGPPSHVGATVHRLGDRFTEFHDSLGAKSRVYRSVLRALDADARTDYVHHHAWPNLVLGHTSIVSLAQIVTPTSPTTSRSSIWLLLRRPDGSVARALRPALTLAAERLLAMVMREDAAVYPDVQRGMEHSTHPGVLGAREERVHAFQQWIADRTSVTTP